MCLASLGTHEINFISFFCEYIVGVRHLRKIETTGCGIFTLGLTFTVMAGQYKQDTFGHFNFLYMGGLKAKFF
ncbi:hypothetical protein D3C76_1239850 [compost metagenome]